MNHFKMLGLLALTTAALMSLGGTAAATVATSNGSVYTSTVTADSSNITFHGSFITFSCTRSHLEAKFESHGPSVTAEGKVSKMLFEGCNYSLTVKKAGALIAHATSGGSATLTSTGTELAIHSSVGECVLTTNGTHIGTLTGGSGAMLDINSSPIPRTGGSFFCGSSMEWTGNYTFSTPGNLSFD